MPLKMGKVRIDASLCGSLPRPMPTLAPLRADSAPPKTPGGLKSKSLSRFRLSTIREGISGFSCVATANGHKLSTQVNRSKSLSTAIVSGESIFSSTNSFDTAPTSDQDEHLLMPRRDSLPTVEPPSWAVPAREDAKLKPVCEALGSHSVIDLTAKACFRVGRSEGSDVQLLHNTSSRRHALIFHHPNGGCYVVDCGSSHGTFVNGVRVKSTPNGSLIIPHRVRRGSLIRFGGPGAPSFVLKSFAVGFSSMVKDLECTVSPSPITEAPPDAEAISIHARLNSVSPLEGGILKKRSFEEGTAAPEAKRQRCVSPASTMLENGPIRLVSPDSPRKSKRVSFHDQPESFYPVLVTPDVLSSDEEDSRS